MDREDLKNLESLGHVVGLHSHDHPTLIEKLSYADQNNQYIRNQSIVSKILNKPISKIKTMSHPCGSYNNETLKILTDLGIDLGFKNIMEIESEKNKSNKQFKFRNSTYQSFFSNENDETMKITLITSNQNRHKFLTNLLSNISSELYVIQEKKTFAIPF